MKTNRLLPTLLAFLFALAVSRAETFKIRNADLPDLANALAALDGSERVVDQGPGNPSRIVREPYKFSGDVRARLAADLAVVVDAAKRAQEKRDALIKQISGGSDRIDPKNSAQMAEFTVSASTLLEAEVALDLSPIATADLNLEANAIPVSVLAALGRLRPKTQP